MVSRSRVVCGGVAGVVALAVLSPPPAGAAVPATTIKTVTTKGFAGYQDEYPGAGDLVGTFVLPTFECHTLDASFAVVVELDNYPSGDTSNFSSAGITGRCHKGTLSYSAILEVNDAYTSSPQLFSPGDKVTASVSAGGSSSMVTVTDDSSGGSATASGSGASFSNVVAGVNGNPKTTPLPFGTIPFSQLTVNGTGFGSGVLVTRYVWHHKGRLAVTATGFTGTSFSATSETEAVA